MITQSTPVRLSPHTGDAELRKGIEYALQRFHSHIALGACPESRKLLLKSFIEMLKSVSPDYGAPLKARIEELFQTLDDLDEAKDEVLAGAAARVEEVEEELESLRTNKSRAIDISLLERINAAIAHRHSLISSADLILNGNGDDNIGLQGKMAELERRLDELKGGAFEDELSAKKEEAELKRQIELVQKSIDLHLGILDKNASEIDALQMHKNAMDLVAKGPPDERLLLIQKK